MLNQILFILIETRLAVGDKNTNETEAIEFLAKYNEEYGKLLNEYTVASWNYETNITDVNEATSQEAAIKVRNMFDFLPK